MKMSFYSPASVAKSTHAAPQKLTVTDVGVLHRQNFHEETPAKLDEGQMPATYARFYYSLLKLSFGGAILSL